MVHLKKQMMKTLKNLHKKNKKFTFKDAITFIDEIYVDLSTSNKVKQKNALSLLMDNDYVSFYIGQRLLKHYTEK